jgi:hypothetical protein
MRIWCIKIGIALVLHFNPWIEASAGGLLVPGGLFSPVAKYSCIALSFDVFGSIPWDSTSIWFFRLYCSFHNFSDFQLFRPEYHWRDLISPNVHLVNQNWYRISFTFKTNIIMHLQQGYASCEIWEFHSRNMAILTKFLNFAMFGTWNLGHTGKICF